MPSDQVADTARLIYAIGTIGAAALCLAGFWGIFVKAGFAGWTAVIPIYNTLILTSVINKPWWWTVLLHIPYLNLLVWIFVAVELAKVEKGSGFTLGLILLPFAFLPVLGFGNACYREPYTD